MVKLAESRLSLVLDTGSFRFVSWGCRRCQVLGHLLQGWPADPSPERERGPVKGDWAGDPGKEPYEEFVVEVLFQNGASSRIGEQVRDRCMNTWHSGREVTGRQKGRFRFLPVAS